MIYKKIAGYLRAGIIAFFSLVLLCIFIRPRGLIVNSGISYYGNYLDTLAPFLLAFLANSALMWKASTMLEGKTKMDKYIKIGLRILAISMIIIVLTPRNFLDLLHKTVGVTAFSVQGMAALTILYLRRNWLNAILVLIATISGCMAIYYLIEKTGYMIEMQIIYQVSIWIIIIKFLNNYEHKKLGNEKIVNAKSGQN